MRQLKWIANAGPDAAVPPGQPAPRSIRERGVWVAATSLLALVAVALAVWAFRAPPQARELRLDIVTPPANFGQSVAVSPDGQQIVFEAMTEGRSQLWLRQLDAISARPLERTEGAVLVTRQRLHRVLRRRQAEAARSGHGIGSRSRAAAQRTWCLKSKRMRVESRGCDPVRPGQRRAEYSRLRVGRHARRGDTPGRGAGDRHSRRSPLSTVTFPMAVTFCLCRGGKALYIGELVTEEARLLLDTAADQTADRATVFMSGHLLYIRQVLFSRSALIQSASRSSAEVFPLAEGVTVVDAAASSDGSVGPIVFRAELRPASDSSCG